MEKEIKVGDCFWLIATSIESDNYDAYGSGYRNPWYGKVTMAAEYNSLKSYRISYFNPETGVVDDDSNATAYVTAADKLFNTKADATRAYLERLKEERKDLEQQIKDLDLHITQVEASLSGEDIKTVKR